MNILFVCTGNTCRSPMAEAILKKHYPEANVRSAGVFAGAGMDASTHAVTALKEKNITFDHHSQPVTKGLLNWADLVLTMTYSHKRSLIMEYPDSQDKYFTIKEYTQDPKMMNIDISDPFGGDLVTYRKTAQEIEEAIQHLIIRLKEN